MTFGPESTNPRERRAYAHAKLARLKKGEATYGEAADAVLNAIHTTKGKASGFAESLGKSAVLLVDCAGDGDGSYVWVKGYPMSAEEAAKWSADAHNDGVYNELSAQGRETYEFQVRGGSSNIDTTMDDFPLRQAINPADIAGATPIL